MIAAVFDASTVISGCGWGAESYHCLVLVARRRIRSFTTEAIIAEWREALDEVQRRGTKFRRDPWPTLVWLIEMSWQIGPTPLGHQRSRDAEDDPYLGCALAAKAQFIVSRDPDLLELGKPFGIEIVTPRQLLSRIQRHL